MPSIQQKRTYIIVYYLADKFEELAKKFGLHCYSQKDEDFKKIRISGIKPEMECFEEMWDKIKQDYDPIYTAPLFAHAQAEDKKYK